MNYLRVGINARLLQSPSLRGWNRYTVNLLAELPGQGVEPVLYTDRPIHEGHLARLPAGSYVVRQSPPLRLLAWEHRWLPRACREDEVALLHSPYNFGLPWSSPCPRVLTLHDAIGPLYHGRRQSWRGRWGRAALRSRLAEWSSRVRAHKIITVSEHAKIDMVEHLGIPAARVVVIAEAADPRFLAPVTEEDRARARARHGLSRPYVFYVGGWDERKRIPALVRAFAAAGLEGVELVLAGGRDEERAALVGLAAGLGVADRLHLLGWVEDEDLPALYAGALCFAYPSEYEGFGLQLCEAMAVGCPTLAARATSLPEVLGAGGEAFELDELPGLLRRVADDATYRAELSRRARARAADFSWRLAAERTAALYRELAAGPGRELTPAGGATYSVAAPAEAGPAQARRPLAVRAERDPMENHRILCVQHGGDHREAALRLDAGGEETYRGQRRKHELVCALAARCQQVGILTITGSQSYDEVVSGALRVLCTGQGPRPDVRQVLGWIERFGPTHLILQTPEARYLEWALRRGVEVLPIFADSFDVRRDATSAARWLARRARHALRMRRLRRLLMDRRVRWVSNHQVPAARELARIGVDPAKVVPYDVFSARHPRDSEPKGLGDPATGWTLCCVGRVSEGKGVFDAVDALAELARRGHRAHLEVAGPGEIEAVRRRAAAAGVADRVTVHGLLDAAGARQVLRRADLTLVLSHHHLAEGIPLVILESLIERTPVVCSDHPMFAQIRGLGDAVAHVPARRPDLVADAVASLLGAPEGYRRLSRETEALYDRLDCPLTHEELIRLWLEATPEADAVLGRHSLAARPYWRRVPAPAPEPARPS